MGDVPLRDAAQALLDAVDWKPSAMAVGTAGVMSEDQLGKERLAAGRRYQAALVALRAALAAADTAPVHNHDYDHGYRQGFRDGLRQNGHDIDALVAAAADEPPRRRRSPEGADHGE